MDFESKPRFEFSYKEKFELWFKDSNQTILESKSRINWISNKGLWIKEN
jgi:hypothetical protein